MNAKRLLTGEKYNNNNTLLYAIIIMGHHSRKTTGVVQSPHRLVYAHRVPNSLVIPCQKNYLNTNKPTLILTTSAESFPSNFERVKYWAVSFSSKNEIPFSSTVHLPTQKKKVGFHSPISSTLFST